MTNITPEEFIKNWKPGTTKIIVMPTLWEKFLRKLKEHLKVVQ